MKDTINIAVVNYYPIEDNVEKNKNKIISIVKSMARMGTDMIVFPDYALTGYPNTLNREELISSGLARKINDSLMDDVVKCSVENQVYSIFGMIEMVGERLYSTIVANTPKGKVITYRKMNLTADEQKWAEKGEKNIVFDSPWGSVILASGTDIYAHHEGIRVARAQGARLIINCAAYSEIHENINKARHMMEYVSKTNDAFVATANLTAITANYCFPGGSSIIGPGCSILETNYYSGFPINENNGRKSAVCMTTIDLSVTEPNTRMKFFDKSSRLGCPDWRPKIYEKMNEDILKEQI